MHTEMRSPVEILLIEDNPGDIGLFNTFFSHDPERCRFHLAKDGEEALAFLQNSDSSAPVRPNLVVLDINIPRIDGTEVLKTLKAHPDLKTIPVIVLTSSESRNDLRLSYEYGANCVLIKPSDVEGVISLFRSMEAFWLDNVRYWTPPTLH